MLSCYHKTLPSSAIPIIPVLKEGFNAWLEKQPKNTQRWINTLNFQARSEEICFVPHDKSGLRCVLIGMESAEDVCSIGILPMKLPPNIYYLDTDWNGQLLQQAIINWGLGAYLFDYYKSEKTSYCAKLVLPKEIDRLLLEVIIKAAYFVRNMINMPACDMTPLKVANLIKMVADELEANMIDIVDPGMVYKFYPSVYAVGQAGSELPHVVDLYWGDKKAPKVTLVGKGVCFDTGGLNLKPASSMRWMKKDLTGAAHAIGLAQMIIAMQLPVRLRVLIPLVENGIDRDSYRPGDVITTRLGKTVEVVNTDAEGRLILADVLTVACEDDPELLIDFASLTGASRVALGMDIPAMFSSDPDVAREILLFSEQEHEPLWQMPLYPPYREALKSNIADLSNTEPDSHGGGAIVAALFLQEFVDPSVSWVHFDLSGWNAKTKAGSPEGGEVFLLRTLFSYLRHRFTLRH